MKDPASGICAEQLLQDLEVHLEAIFAAATLGNWDRVGELDRETPGLFRAMQQADALRPAGMPPVQSDVIERVGRILSRQQEVIALLREQRDAIALESQKVTQSRQGVRAYLDHH